MINKVIIELSNQRRVAITDKEIFYYQFFPYKFFTSFDIPDNIQVTELAISQESEYQLYLNFGPPNWHSLMLADDEIVSFTEIIAIG